MNRGNFIRELVDAGCYLKRPPVPRHPEIKEMLVKKIKGQLGI